MSSTTSTRDQLMYTYYIFHPIRERFKGGSVERGGHLREGVTPAYARRLKSSQQAAQHGSYTVEASFSETQLKYVHETLVALRNLINGKASTSPLSEKIVEHYLSPTAPYFGLALLKATEQLLQEFISLNPDHAATLDAIFRVAGADGFRDLIQIYGIRLLNAVLSSSEITPLPLLAFVDIHDAYRKNEAGVLAEAKYEVWCPGQSLAQAYFDQCAIAARQLVTEYKVTFAPSSQEELRSFASELSTHLRGFLKSITQPVLTEHNIT